VPYGVSWREDGQELALPGFLGAIRLRPDGSSLTQLPSMLGQYQFWSAAWGPGQALAAGSFEGVLNWSNGGSDKCSPPLGDWIYATGWSPDGEHLAGGLKDGSVHIFSRSNCKEVSIKRPFHRPVTGLSWGRGGLAASSIGAQNVELYYDDSGDSVEFSDKSFDFSDSPVDVPSSTIWGGVQWSPDGKVLATLDEHGVLALWKDNPWVQTFQSPEKGAFIASAALSHDGEVARSSYYTVYLWHRLPDGKWRLEPIPPRTYMDMT
jgi:WD40 repeat protein